MELEERSFLAYRERATRETLLAVLRAQQSSVYNLCFQVLRNAHDAEDAAQEVLLEVIRGVDGILEPRAFKRWLCRVALHTALDHLRRRNRRARHEEKRAAMIPTPADSTGDAVHEAMSRLDDEDRCLLVEKYFERATLQEIAGREGVSAAAVAKRLDRAKERLKRRLSAIGMAAVIPRVDSFLEGTAPIVSIPDLVSTSAAVKSAVALAGSAVIGTKVVVVAAFLILIGAAGGYFRLASRAGSPSATSGPASGRALEKERDPSEATSSSEGREAPSPPPTPGGELLSRLQRFRLWYDKFRPPTQEATFSLAEPEEEALGVWAELLGVRALILKHPAVFLDWAALPGNSRCMKDLVDATIARKAEDAQRNNSEFLGDPLQSCQDFPEDLVDGLFRLLQAGNAEIRQALLRFALTLRDAPPSWRRQFVAILKDGNEEVSDLAIEALLESGNLSVEEIRSIIELTERNEVTHRALGILSKLGRASNPEVRDQLVLALESGRIPDKEGQATVAALNWWLSQDTSPGDSFEDRAARLLLLALNHATTGHSYSEIILRGLKLAPHRAQSLLAHAATAAPTAKLRSAALAVLEQAKSPGASAYALQGAWTAAVGAK